ncbi:hypothetical protein MC885_005320 [Smutsia gigantea]|nr:hypothetical protein MC885_005320 [Smutsia gigantea]
MPLNALFLRIPFHQTPGEPRLGPRSLPGCGRGSGNPACRAENGRSVSTPISTQYWTPESGTQDTFSPHLDEGVTRGGAQNSLRSPRADNRRINS